MQHLTNQGSQSSKTMKNSKNKNEGLRNIISLRISDDERKTLETLSQSTSKNISDIMREAIEQWDSNRHKLCQD